LVAPRSSEPTTCRIGFLEQLGVAGRASQNVMHLPAPSWLTKKDEGAGPDSAPPLHHVPHDPDDRHAWGRAAHLDALLDRVPALGNITRAWSR
jgi:hypothetical protein